jgi:hypothetical protein
MFIAVLKAERKHHLGVLLLAALGFKTPERSVLGGYVPSRQLYL